MKNVNQITASVIASLLITACGSSLESESKKSEGTTTQQDVILSAKDLLGQDYVIQNEAQEFKLRGLGHLYTSQLTCELESPEVTGQVKVSFHPDLQVTLLDDKGESRPLASKQEVCGQKVQTEKGLTQGTGSLILEDEDEMYSLNYFLNSDASTWLHLSWSYEQPSEGSLICMVGNSEIVHRAELRDCEMVSPDLNLPVAQAAPVPTEPVVPEIIVE